MRRREGGNDASRDGRPWIDLDRFFVRSRGLAYRSATWGQDLLSVVFWGPLLTATLPVTAGSWSNGGLVSLPEAWGDGKRRIA
jgi:hypothetical protein